MSPNQNQADDFDYYATIESTPLLNETFMSQVGAFQYLCTNYRSDSQLSEGHQSVIRQSLDINQTVILLSALKFIYNQY